MELVIIESPYAEGNGYTVEENEDYALRALADSLNRGEAPFASHLFYTTVLDDDIGPERERGIRAGFAWGDKADLVAVYTDHGLSAGMYAGIQRAQAAGQRVEYRTLKKEGGWRSAAAPLAA